MDGWRIYSINNQQYFASIVRATFPHKDCGHAGADTSRLRTPELIASQWQILQMIKPFSPNKENKPLHVGQHSPLRFTGWLQRGAGHDASVRSQDTSPA